MMGCLSCQSNTESITDIDLSEIDTKKTVDNEDLFYKIKSWDRNTKRKYFSVLLVTEGSRVRWCPKTSNF